MRPYMWALYIRAPLDEDLVSSVSTPFQVSAGQVRVEAPRQDIYAFQGRFSVRDESQNRITVSQLRS